MSKMTIKRVKIFCFSGTGNSRNVSLWLKEAAETRNLEASIKELPIDGTELPDIKPEDTIIITSPVHGFNYPPLVIGFLIRFPRGNNNVILMNTRAGMKIGRWITPGLSGITFYLAAIILMIKGYNIKGMIPIDMPSNWISIHPGLNKNTIEFLHQENYKRVTALANKIFNGDSCFIALKELFQDILISPIAFAYYFIGRYILAKTYFTTNLCNNCELCKVKCPAKAIKFVDQRPYWTLKCESCMRCLSFCPQHSIETAHGLVAVIILAYSTITLYLLFPVLQSTLLYTSPLVNFIFESLLFLFLMISGYRIFHLLIKYRFIQQLFVWTSLTHYKFWGRRYRALKNFPSNNH